MRTALLRRLPDAANLWTVGTILTGWARPPAAGNCRVAEIWLAAARSRVAGRSRSARPSALGVNLPDGQRVTAIELAQVDPLPGPVALTSQVGIGGQTGRGGARDAGRWPGRRDLPDVGRARWAGRIKHWYFEVGPDGRQAAEVNAFVTSAQR